MEQLLTRLRSDSDFQTKIYASFLTGIVLKYSRYKDEVERLKQDFEQQTETADTYLKQIAGTEFAPDHKWDFVDNKLPSWWSAFQISQTNEIYYQRASKILSKHNALDMAKHLLAQQSFKLAKKGLGTNGQDLTPQNPAEQGVGPIELGQLRMSSIAHNRVSEFVNNQLLERRQSSRNDKKRSRRTRGSTVIQSSTIIMKKWVAEALRACDLFDKSLPGHDDMFGIKSILQEYALAFANSPHTLQSQPLTFMIMGAPGTGKTTIAKKMASIFKALGFLLLGDLKTADRSDFVGEYVGQTAPKVKSFLMSNLEKVVLIDEAYSLVSRDSHGELESFSAEAIDALTFWITELSGLVCVVAAGYEEEMKTRFLGANQGLRRRFQNQIVLSNYTSAKLVNIFRQKLTMMAARAQMMGPRAYKMLRSFIDICMSPNSAVEVGLDFSVTEQDVTDPTGELERAGRTILYRTQKSERQLMYALFEAQAGAMEQLAAVASLYLNSKVDECDKKKIPCFNTCDMAGIIMTYANRSHPDTYNVVLKPRAAEIFGKLMVDTKECSTLAKILKNRVDGGPDA